MPQINSQQNRRSGRSPALAPVADPSLAEIEDHVYGIVSVLYHALQGVQACEQYIDDAERAGDDELAKFFEECRDTQSEQALRAKQLLVGRAGGTASGEGEEA